MTQHLRTLTTVFILAAIIFGTALFSETGVTANNSGAPAMRTGSPGDTKSCTICHSGTAQNLAGIMTSTVPASGYVPGSTYTVTATCTDASRNRFGFEISPQNVAGAKLGTLTITDAVRTKLVGSGKYVTHTAAGTSGTGTITWSFNWTAPPAGTGDVTMYGAFNFTNHNNSSSGDVIKLSTLTLSEDLTTWTESISAVEEIKLYPNPVSDVAHILIPETSQLNQVSIFSVNGSCVRTYETSGLEKQVDLNISGLAAGTYYVAFTTAKGTYSGKLIKL